MEVLQRTANRGSISDGGYEIANSVKLEQPERLQRGYDGAGNIGSITATDRKKTTLSYWVKRTQLNASGNGIVFIMYAGNTIMLGFEQDKLRVSTSYGYSLISNALFRDTSAWYNLVFSIDTTQGTANNRVKVYVNGAEYTDWGTQSISISQNANNGMFNEVNGSHYFGWSDAQATGCYVAEAHCIDGQALAASDFGEYDEDSGIWIPKEYTGTYGNQGYYLNFDDSSALGTDSSGNGNNFGTFYGGGAENQATDTPTNNFAVLNAIQPLATSTTITEGATQFFVNSNWQTAVSTIAVSKGKWYMEIVPNSASCYVGFVDVSEWTIPQRHDGYFLGYAGASQTMSVGMKGTDGVIGNDNNSATGATFAASDVVGLALDMDNRRAYWAVNNTWVNSGNPSTGANPVTWYTARDGATGTWTDVITMGVSGFSSTTFKANFGGYTAATPSSPASDANGYGTFEYAPPTGYYALCTKNLAEFG